ncbi:MAG TPA: sulfite exporter TauE/SafE family protein [Thermoanaerobaculia bacterium]
MIPPETIILFLGGVAAGVIGSFFAIGSAIVIVPLLMLILKVPIHYAIATSLMCVVASDTTKLRPSSVLDITAAVGTFVFYCRGDLRPVITATVLLGVIAGAQARRLFGERTRSSILRLTVALSWCLFLVGVLADAVDPIAFGIIKPEHIPLLPGALIHGRPAAMMHIGILLLLVTPVVRLVYSYSVESVH